MYKKILFIFSNLFFITFVYANDLDFNIQDFIENQINNVYDYKKQFYQDRINHEQIKQINNKWMPRLYFDSQFKYNYNPLFEESYIHGFNYSNMLSFNQKLPLGMYVSGELFSYTGVYQDKDLIHLFNYLGVFEFSIPLLSYLFGYINDLSYIDMNEKNNFVNCINLNKKFTEAKILNVIITQVGLFLYLKELTDFYLKKENFLLEYKSKFEQMLINNQISLSELLDVNQEILENNKLYNEAMKNFISIKDELNKIGVKTSEIDFDVEQWIAYCCDLDLNISDVFYDNEFYFLQQQWIEKSKSYLNMLPTLNISLITTPLSSDEYNLQKSKSFLEDFSYHWGTIENFDVKLNFSIRINLMSYDDVYINRKKLEYEKKIFDVNLHSLSQKRIMNQINKNENLQYYINYSKTSYEYYLQEKKQFTWFNEMFQKNLISKYELDSTQLYVEQLYLDFIKSVLDYINFDLSYY